LEISGEGFGERFGTILEHNGEREAPMFRIGKNCIVNVKNLMLLYQGSSAGKIFRYPSSSTVSIKGIQIKLV
jgi:hypothetical protein